MVKTGIGYDVHKLKKGLPLVVGGVLIKSSFGSIGHSDGDALMHSITDSLLGAAGLGDIGKFFPSDDKKWEDAQSHIFLSEANKMIKKSYNEILHLDCTVILQKPKISKYIPKIRTNIARILNLNETSVSIKATTTDFLGAIGRSEGWSAMAVSTISNTHE